MDLMAKFMKIVMFHRKTRLLDIYTHIYCLTACLYAKCWNLIGWIMERGPSIRLSIKVKMQDFWEDGREAIDRGCEKLVMFGKLSVNFRKLSGKT